MNGQGRPHRATRLESSIRAAGLLVTAWLLTIPLHADVPSPTAPETVRLRLAWGGGAPRSWSGQIRVVPGGQIAMLRPLGLDADAPGSMWSRGDTLHVARQTLRRYDGVECEVTAASNAELEVELAADEAPPRTIRVPLQLAATGTFRELLDENRNFLLVRRAPGDELRIQHDAPTMIFSVGETFEFDLLPIQLASGNAGPLDVVAELMPARSSDVAWASTMASLPSDGGREHTSFSVPLPDQEGVFDIRLQVFEPQGFAGRLVPGVGRRAIASRRVQVIVIDPRRNHARSSSFWRQLLTIDPTSPGWSKRLPKWLLVDRIPGTRPQSLTNAPHTVHEHTLGRLLELPPRGAAPADPAWHALMLPIERMNQPHLIEIELPDDESLDLAISILEPNAAGRVVPIGRDFGVSHEPASPVAEPQLRTHRIIFWPRTDAPVLLLANRHDTSPARFGKLNVFVHDGPLERTTPIYAPAAGSRIVAAHLQRPHFAESLGAADAFDEQGGYAIDDWQTFYEGGTRLVEYLSYAGYNAAFLSVMADGSTIYPSPLLEPTPIHDTGGLSTTGQDPQRKDVLELLLRQFTRDGLMLFPVVTFNAPLPAVERELRGQGDPQSGLMLIGANGQTWPDDAVTGVPRYNLLSPVVQEAVVAIVNELVMRYADHPSMAGLAIELSRDSFLHLPGLEWGFDDTTVRAFESETGIRVPGEGPQRFATRAEYLLGTAREDWLKWRCGTLNVFFQQLEKRITASNPDRRLFLLPSDLVDQAAFLPRNLPAFRSGPGLQETLREMGLDFSGLGEASRIVVARPYQRTYATPFAESAVGWRLNGTRELDNALDTSQQQASIFYSRTRPLRLPSFDAQSPFGKEATAASLLPHADPLDATGRQPMLHALVSRDDDVLIDSGMLLPTVDSPSMQQFRNTYRQLPPHAALVSETREQSVTVRTYQESGGAVVAVLNDSPWPVETTISLQAPAGCTLVQLGGSTRVSRPRTVSSGSGGMAWKVTLAPYELHAARFSSTGVRPVAVEIEHAPRTSEWLAGRIERLKERVTATATPRPVRRFNQGGFESASDPDKISGWSVEPPELAGNVVRDTFAAHQGEASLRVTAAADPVSVVSDAFACPSTGRLLVQFWIKAESADIQPAVRFVVEDADDSRRYQQYAVVRGSRDDGVPLKTEWWWYELKLDTLPLTETTRMRVRIDVAGAGSVWIDDVNVFDLVFNERERRELLKIVFEADSAFREGMLAECAQVLDGYWPRYLAVNRPDVAATPSLPQPPQIATKPDPEPSVADRLKNFVPTWLK